MSSNLSKAIIEADWGNNTIQKYEVMFNPKEFSLEKNLQHGEINIPGLDAPLQQFVRGQAEKLSVELFFDTTENGMGKDASPVTVHTDKIYRLAKIESSSHAPPVVTFRWGKGFPGSSLYESESSDNQSRNSFVGVVESVRQQFTLFSPEGVPLRATVNLVLKEYRTLEEQLIQLRLNSPDRTHSHPLKDAETLSNLSGKYYGNCKRWRFIARENDITDPRRLNAGRIITVPSIK
jgi:Contractile injection system tube protein